MRKNPSGTPIQYPTGYRALVVLNITAGTYNSTSIQEHYDNPAISANTYTQTTQHTSTGPALGSFSVNDAYKDVRFDPRFSQTIGMNEVLTSFAAHGLKQRLAVYTKTNHGNNTNVTASIITIRNR